MSILKLMFSLNPKNLKLIKASEMTQDMAQQIDSFLGKIGALASIGKYQLTPQQSKYWIEQRKELTKFENKLNEMRSRNKLKKKEGIETLPEADIIEFPGKWNPPEGEPFAAGGRVGLMAGGILKGKKILDALKKANKTKTVTKVLTEDELRALGIKENIDKEKIEKFISGEFTKIPRAQKRGLVTRDKEGNIIIKDKYSTKYDPYRKIMSEQKINQYDLNNKNKLITKNAENELIQARKNVGESQDFVGNDVKYDARLLAEELAQVRYKTDYSDLDLDSQLDLFDESYNHLLDLIQERGQIKGAINLRTGKNILTGRQERAPEALPGEDFVPPKKRTLNADGGLITLFTKK